MRKLFSLALLFMALTLGACAVNGPSPDRDYYRCPYGYPDYYFANRPDYHCRY